MKNGTVKYCISREPFFLLLQPRIAYRLTAEDGVLGALWGGEKRQIMRIISWKFRKKLLDGNIRLKHIGIVRFARLLWCKISLNTQSVFILLLNSLNTVGTKTDANKNNSLLIKCVFSVDLCEMKVVFPVAPALHSFSYVVMSSPNETLHWNWFSSSKSYVLDKPQLYNGYLNLQSLMPKLTKMLQQTWHFPLPLTNHCKAFFVTVKPLKPDSRSFTPQCF